MSNETLNKIASVHLGKAGDGTVVKPYVTPDEIDSSLLVGIPRSLNRIAYGIEENDLPFVGFDIWNCYEVSTLLDNGYPVTGVIKLVYPCDSKNIVESKSLKLYLNSFNMAKSGPIIAAARGTLKERIDKDLHSLGLGVDGDAGAGPYLSFKTASTSVLDISRYHPFSKHFYRLEQNCNVMELQFNDYEESPDILQVVGIKEAQRWTTDVLRSNCRVTNQPDWGDIFIYIDGKKGVTPDSLLKYIVSMRKENHFHEEIVEMVYKRLYDLLAPKDLLVAALYTRRGGIDICPVRASSDQLLHDVAGDLVNPYLLNHKTMKQ